MDCNTTPPFRADHVGSLLRPPELLRARPSATPAGSQPKNCAVSRTGDPRRGQDAGGDRPPGVTDGEYRRGSWHMDFLYQIGGVAKVRQMLRIKFHNEEGDIESAPRRLRVTGKLTFDKTIFAEDFAYLKSVRQPERRRS